MQSLRHLIEHPLFTRAIVGLIVFNGIILGLETVPAVNNRFGPLLHTIDAAILAIFVAELALRLVAYRLAFFRDPWNLFDLAIVGISLAPVQQGLSVLRALRVLRVLRLISALPQLRAVVSGLVKAVPGLASIMLIMSLVFYVFAVMAVKLFGGEFPELFGSFGAALFTLFQIMTLEGWADIVRDIMKSHPYAWVYFVCYILVSTFTVLNLFIAVIVDAMQSDTKDEMEEEHKVNARIEAGLAEIKADLQALRQQLPAARP